MLQTEQLWELQLGDISVDVVSKDILNVHLSVHPPTGRVRIAAPQRMEGEAIRLFAISKLDWIKEQQRKLNEQERDTPREFLERESHWVWGKRYLMTIEELDAPPAVSLVGNRLRLATRPGSNELKREQVIEQWYRGQVRRAAEEVIESWEERIQVEVSKLFVQRMKTRWGSCNSTARTIRLNTELAKKPPECLEYIVVHEMVHFLEPTHNARFQALIKSFIPNWKSRRDALNRLPVRHEDWTY